MPSYKLKKGQEQFQVVEGPCEGRRYHPDTLYQDIPPEECIRFESVEIVETETKKRPEKVEGKK